MEEEGNNKRRGGGGQQVRESKKGSYHRLSRILTQETSSFLQAQNEDYLLRLLEDNQHGVGVVTSPDPPLETTLLSSPPHRPSFKRSRSVLVKSVQDGLDTAATRREVVVWKKTDTNKFKQHPFSYWAGCACAVKFRNQAGLLTFGGAMTQLGVPRTRSNTVYFYSIEQDDWTRVKFRDGPWRRYGAAMVYLSGLVYVFGGKTSQWIQHAHNELFILDLRKDEMKIKYTEAKVLPDARVYHTFSSVRVGPNNAIMVVYGGKNKSTVFGDVWSLSPEDNPEKNFVRQQVEPDPEHGEPQPRWSHTATVISDKRIVIFGGEDANNVFNDMWILHLSEQEPWRWEKQETKNEGPYRACHAASALIADRSLLIVVGGLVDRNRTYTDSMWLFDFDLNLWKEVLVNGEEFPKVAWHSMVSLDPGEIILLGGGNSDHWVDMGKIYYGAKLSGTEEMDIIEWVEHKKKTLDKEQFGVSVTVHHSRSIVVQAKYLDYRKFQLLKTVNNEILTAKSVQDAHINNTPPWLEKLEEALTDIQSTMPPPFQRIDESQDLELFKPVVIQALDIVLAHIKNVSIIDHWNFKYGLKDIKWLKPHKHPIRRELSSLKGSPAFQYFSPIKKADKIFFCILRYPEDPVTYPSHQTHGIPFARCTTQDQLYQLWTFIGAKIVAGLKGVEMKKDLFEALLNIFDKMASDPEPLSILLERFVFYLFHDRLGYTYETAIAESKNCPVFYSESLRVKNVTHLTAEPHLWHYDERDEFSLPELTITEYKLDLAQVPFCIYKPITEIERLKRCVSKIDKQLQNERKRDVFSSVAQVLKLQHYVLHLVYQNTHINYLTYIEECWKSIFKILRTYAGRLRNNQITSHTLLYFIDQCNKVEFELMEAALSQFYISADQIEDGSQQKEAEKGKGKVDEDEEEEIEETYEQNHNLPLIKKIFTNNHRKELDDIFNCVVCSELVYDSDPILSLNEDNKNFYSHSIDNIHKYERKKYGMQMITAEIKSGKKKREFILCFRGTASKKDVLCDVNVTPKYIPSNWAIHKNADFNGTFHYGFLEQANAIPFRPLLKLIKSGRSLTITGHSLGAAVAATLTTKLLVHPDIFGDAEARSRISMIGFGAPLWGDERLAEFVNENNMTNNFKIFANYKDPVPGCLFHLESIVEKGGWLSSLAVLSTGYKQEEIKFACMGVYLGIKEGNPPEKIRKMTDPDKIRKWVGSYDSLNDASYHYITAYRQIIFDLRTAISGSHLYSSPTVKPVGDLFDRI